jgi:hypothetical protein
MKTVPFEFLEQGRTVNQHCYSEILARLRENVCQRRPELWILHHDNALAHDAFTVQEFFGQKTDNEIGPSTIFTRFCHVQLLTISKTEDHFEGPQIFRHFQHSETCDDHPAEHSRREVPEMFEQCKYQLIKCIAAQGDYFEGDSNH